MTAVLEVVKEAGFKSVHIIGPDSSAQSSPSDPSPRDLNAFLEEKVSLVFEDIHLAEIVKFVSENYDINVLYDNRVVAPPPAAAEGEAPEGADYVTDGIIPYINLKNVSLRQALEGLLRPLNLDFSVQRGFIWISTPENIATESF